MDRPNVFFLVVDSLRADAVFGDEVPTPNLDALAGQGAAFTQCVATATTTTPSFSSILTGCYPPKHGVRGLQGYRLSSALQTMPEMFARAGYHTYAEVTGPLVPETGILRGFEQAHHRPAYKVPFFGWREDVLARMRSYVDPWFMLLHIWEVHRPYRSPPTFEKRKDKGGYQAAVTATDDWLAPVLDAASDALVVVTGDHGEEYPSTMVEFQAVRAARKARRTLKLESWFPYLDAKFAGMEIGHGFALWEHLVRVPLILRDRGAPRVVDDQVRHVDILPTLADLCGLDAPKGIDGRSVVALLEGGTVAEQPAYMEAVGVKLGGKRIVGARTPEWKLLIKPGARPSLYKLNGGSPPDEKHNVYARHPEAAHALERYVEHVTASAVVSESGFTRDEEAIIEQNLRDLGYL